MGNRTIQFSENEWYHCYSRTVDRSRPFEESLFVYRFLETLYFANSENAMPVFPHLYKQYAHDDLFSLERDKPLVAIGAYCLMPTHYHLLIQPLAEEGITRFMRKAGTGFTNFYNEQNGRVGNLFVKPFRAKHIGTDHYLNRVVQYIHLNPVELFESDWKKGVVSEPRLLPQRLRSYAHSSLFEHEGGIRPQSSIVNLDVLGNVRDNVTDAAKMIDDAAEYYRFLELDL
jgi:REP element-mobilizing transposase RayT